MTPEKLKRLIDGQTNIAKKVLEAVPVQEAWPPHQIGQTLKLMTRSTVEHHILRGCLASLKDAGIIREPVTGHFQRVVANAAPVVPMPAPEAKKEETKMTTPVISQPAAKKPTLDVLAQVTSEIARAANEFHACLKKQITALEEVALAVEQEKQAHRAELEKFEQLRGLLKSIQG